MGEHSSSPGIPTNIDILSHDSQHTHIIKHVFALSGPKSKPAQIDVNGNEERRAICVVYGDGEKYEVLDLDAEVEEEAEAEDETGSNI